MYRDHPCSDKIDETLDILNSRCESIKFTFETEKDNKLPFLDLEIQRVNESVDFGLYHEAKSTMRNMGKCEMLSNVKIGVYCFEVASAFIKLKYFVNIFAKNTKSTHDKIIPCR